MPYGFCLMSSSNVRKVTTVGHPKRDRAKTKAARQARRTRRR